MPKIIITEPGGIPQPYRLDNDHHVISIGRHSDNDIVISCPSASSHHCSLEYTESGHILRDGNSTNGIELKGKLMKEIPLVDGIEAFIGDVSLVFQLSREEQEELKQVISSLPPSQQRATANNSKPIKIALAALAIIGIIGVGIVLMPKQDHSESDSALSNESNSNNEQMTLVVDKSASWHGDYENIVRPFFENHCIKCHGPEETKGDMRLDTLAHKITDDYIAEHWQDILDALNSGEMPTEKEPRPPTDKMAEVIEVITTRLYEAQKRLVDSRTQTIRRLNKREYVNTIQDLLGVPVDTVDLPEDGEVEGFDTVGEGHFMSTVVFDQYLKLGRKALEQALVAGSAPEKMVARNEPEKERYRKLRGPLTTHSTIPGLEKKLKAMSKRDPKRKELASQIALLKKQVFSTVEYVKQKGTDTGFIMDLTSDPFRGLLYNKVWVKVPNQKGKGEGKGEAKLGKPIGKYIFRCRVALTCKLGKGQHFYIDVERNDKINQQRSYSVPLGTFEITQTLDSPQIIEVPFENEGQFNELITMRTSPLSSRKKPSRYHKRRFPDTSRTPYVWIDWVEVEGPFLDEWPTKAWQATFSKGIKPSRKKESAYAREVIERFATRAFRQRLPTQEYLDKLHGIYGQYRKDGLPFFDAMKDTLAIVLASPSFVYIVEKSPDEGEAKHTLSDLELASRLSYFLWSSPPDKELYALAKKKELTKPEVLRGQVERMLDNPKGQILSQSFMEQWLELEWLDMIVINGSKYPKFNGPLRRAFREEPIAFFSHLIKEDLSVANFIDSDFVLINPILAAFYGIDMEEKSGFHPVKLPKDSPRGGLLGQGAVLTMTGTGERTSPVERGVFVYSHLLGKSIPPPPPNVPQLEFNEKEKSSVRDVLSMHTSKAQCASCHRKIDPLGFGLENFNAIGQWRANEKKAIDATGMMPDRKRSFNGHEELKNYLLEDKDEMAKGFLRSFLTYSLGRRVGFADGEFVDQMQADWKKKEYGMRSLIHTIVQSKEFKNK